jgi:flagellar biosynthetic protein FliR
MRSEFAVNFSLLHSFLLVLARVAGAFIFVPLPGVKNAPEMSRAVLILAIAMALYPVWPHVSGEPVLSTWLGSVVVEATFGLCIGLLVGFIAEVLVVFGQIAGLQAGYSFASTVDPSTQADSTILTVLAESMGSLLFVSFGLHREVIRIFAGSL